jgi:hypothetical protein
VPKDAIFALGCWLALLFSPILALAVFAVLERFHPNISGHLARLSAAMVAITVIAVVARIGLSSGMGEVFWVLLCWFGYCFLVAFCFRIRQKILRIIAIVFGILPVLAGYVAITLMHGAALFVFILVLFDWVSSPRSEAMADGTVCEVKTYGFVGSASGHTVRLYRHLPYIPLIRQMIDGVQIDETSGDEDVSCAELYAKSRK